MASQDDRTRWTSQSPMSIAVAPVARPRTATPWIRPAVMVMPSPMFPDLAAQRTAQAVRRMTTVTTLSWNQAVIPDVP
jgi:hypothetical protein